MASEQKTGNEGQREQGSENSTVGGIRESILTQYRKTRENIEAYPYVWASYAIVYGGIGLWVSYRYTKLRRKEDTVMALQEKLRKLRQERAPKSSLSANDKPTSSSTDKSSK
uniref:uncharacterized protein LOC122597613 n=1 Tax=Erigeron canadensis TaxID=72917 RepID=UPI001CB97593|nr:uncharacterized protein LOC122597613 [Erigeron canadensis]